MLEEPDGHCERCGTCCRGSSPTLHQCDLPLMMDGVVARSELYAIRRGELVRDNIHFELKTTPTEMLKVRERAEGGGCIFYDPEEHACLIYARRPAQCAAFECWDIEPFMEVFQQPKAARTDLVQDPLLLRLMREHEEHCAYGSLDQWVRSIPDKGEEAVEAVLEVLHYDHHLRLLAVDKLGLNPAELDFLFGRPLLDTIVMFGLQVIREPDGSFFLTTRHAPGDVH